MAFAIRSNISKDEFHEAALDSFMMRWLQEQLKQQYVYQIQDNMECLTHFIWGHSRVCPSPMLRTVGGRDCPGYHRGVTPAGKSQLVFQERLRSFADLDHLCVVSRSIQMNDEASVPLHPCPSVSWLTKQNAITFQM